MYYKEKMASVDATALRDVSGGARVREVLGPFPTNRCMIVVCMGGGQRNTEA